MAHPLVTKELVLRLEAAEAGYNTAKLRALQAADDNARGVEIAHLGGTVLHAVQSRRNNPSVNRAACFRTEDLAHLEDILDWLRRRSAYYWLDVAPALVDDATLKSLADAGLYPSFFLNVVCATPQEPQEPSPASIAVDEIDLRVQDHGFSLAFSEGFGVPLDRLESTRRSAQIEYGAPGWRTYLATVEGQPAAMAALYLEDETASIDAMATVPRHRRRGCQSALLRRCLSDAARAGCTLIASQTRPSSVSERNFARAGFRIAYTKLLYAPRRPGAFG